MDWGVGLCSCQSQASSTAPRTSLLSAVQKRALEGTAVSLDKLRYTLCRSSCILSLRLCHNYHYRPTSHVGWRMCSIRCLVPARQCTTLTESELVQGCSVHRRRLSSDRR